MNKIYSPINWENEPSSNTPINEANLNKMDTAINELDNRVISQDTIKANKADLSNLIKEWVIDETTGVITLTKYNGEQVIFDLNIEKVPVSFYLDDDGILYMTTDDGTTFSANIGSMIPILTFEPSDTIAVSVSGSGVNKTYSFSIKTASVTEDLLQPNFLADIWTAANNAELSADKARDYATQSQSYAVGGTGSRDGEDTDNAKHYKEQVQSIYNDLAKGQVLGVKGSNETAYRTGNVEITPENIGALPEDSNIAMLYRGNITANTTNIETLPMGVYGVGNVKGLAYNIKPYSYVYKANSSNMYGSLMVLFQSGDARGVYHFDASVNEFRRTVRADELDGSKVACEVFTDFTVDGVTYSNSNAEVRYLYMTNSNNSRLFELGYVTSTSDATAWEKYIVPNKLVCRRYVDENGWSEWCSVALNTDLSGYLPLNGNARGLGIDDTAANRLITQAYTGTKTTNDGRMYVQADHTNKCVNVGILGLGAVGVNKALNAGWATYLGDSSDKYSAILPRTKNGTPSDKVTGPMFIQADYEKTLIKLGFNGLGTVPVYLAYADQYGHQIANTYTPMFSLSNEYDSLADFVSACMAINNGATRYVFGRFEDNTGWTGKAGWYRAEFSWQNNLGNGEYSVDGVIKLVGNGVNRIGFVDGDGGTLGALTVAWYDVATSGNQWVDITSECTFGCSVNTEGTYKSWVKYNQITKEVKACISVNENVVPDASFITLPDYITFTGYCGSGVDNDMDKKISVRCFGRYISAFSNKGAGYNLTNPIFSINFIAD